MPAAPEQPSVDIVAIVGSAGAVGAMQAVIGQLPCDLPAAVVVVLHLTATRKSMLTPILARATKLAVREASDGEPLLPGHVYVAPPASHLLVGPDGRVHLDQSELVHHVRPSADVLLLSIARDHPGRCLAVVLSGTGIDGAAGAAAVKQAGGTVVAQDEATSQHFGMPGAAILAGGVDEVLALDAIGDAVIHFASRT